MTATYDPNWVREFYDASGIKEWHRWDGRPSMRIAYHIHTHYLQQYIRPGMRVLEIGAGAGRFTQVLAETGACITVADISPGQLAVNQQQAADLGFAPAIEQWVECDAIDLHGCFGDEEFDAVVAYGGLISYLYDQADTALMEFQRVVNPGGVIIRVPGVAVGIVKRQRCIATYVYGKRDVEQNLPVTEQTLFEIGSITKSFTATALGMLVDEGKLEWDRPIREYLPQFELADPAVSVQVTLRDLLAHRTGLPRHDYAHFGSMASREELVMRLRHLPLSAPFRTTFQYTNLQYVAPGWILEQLTGITWEEFLRTQIFHPLMMRSATFLNELTGKEANLARGYESNRKPLESSVPARYFLVNAGPAGAITATIGDMCRWLAFQVGTQTLLKEETLTSLSRPVIVRSPWPDIEVVNPAYGMGWQSMAYRGHLCVEHAGGTSGFCSQMTFLPKERIGVVVLTNGATHLLPMTLAFNVIDRLLDLPPADWHARTRRVERKREAERKAKAPEQSQPASPTPELAAYAGTYRNPGYGSLTVRATQEAILVDFHRIGYTLHQKSDGGFEIVSPWDRRFPAKLARDDRGEPTLAIDFEPAVSGIVFERD